jgi:hypothetical protein
MITYANKFDALVPNVVVPGQKIYVSSLVGNNNNSGSKGSPMASIAGALTKCTANAGDYIYLLPGHTSTITGAASVEINVAGVTIEGLGNGAKRPTLTWSATDSSLAISAANVTLKNVITTISIDEVVSMFLVTGANATLDAVDFVPYGALGVTGQAIQWLLTSTAGDGICIKNCKHYQKTAAAANQVWIDLNGVDYPRVINNIGMFTAKAATASHWIGTTAACNEVEIANNRVLWLGATITGVITCAAGTTGMIYGNYVGSGTSVATATAIVADSAFVFENYWIDDAAASAILTPGAGTD